MSVVVFIGLISVQLCIGEPARLLQPPRSRTDILGDVTRKIIPLQIRGVIERMDVSPNGNLCACIMFDGTFLLSFPEAKLIRKLTPGGEELEESRVTFSPDSKRVMLVGPGFRVWDAETGKLLVSKQWDWERSDREKYRGFRRVPAFSPDRKRLLVSGANNDFHVIDTDSGNELQRVATKGLTPLLFAVSADGKRQAFTAESNRVFQELVLLKADDFTELSRADLPWSNNDFFIHFLEDGEHLLIIGPEKKGERNVIRIWDCRRGKFEPSTMPAILSSLQHNSVALCTIEGGRYALVSGQAEMYVYDLDVKKYVGMIRTKQFCPSPLIVSSDKKMLIGGNWEKSFVIINVEDVLKLIPKPEPDKKP